MPCRSDEEFAQGPDEPNAVTPPRRRINDGAGRDKSDVEISDENDEHEVANPEKTKRVRELLSWTTVKTWVTGERAQFEDADIHNILCISTIPNKTESQTTYTITWEDLHKAACLVPTIVHCGAADCECCESVFE
jgi:hypothetical protein